MKNHIILLTISGLFAFSVNAQTSSEDIKRKYETETIYLTGYGNYVKNGEILKTGYYGGKMAKEFEASPQGKTLFNSYTSQRKASTILGVGMIAGFIGHYLLIDYDNMENPDNNLAWASYGAGLAFGTASIYTGINSYKNLEKSVWLRNRDIFQDEEVKKKYESEVLYLLNSNNYIKGNQKQKIGFGGRKMKSEFEISPEGMAVFKKYQSQEKKGLLWFGAGMATMIGAAFLIDYDNPSSSKNYLAAGTYAAGGIMTAISISNLVHSQKNFQKAIWLRNRDAIAKN
jgi:hypothetical protein